MNPTSHSALLQPSPGFCEPSAPTISAGGIQSRLMDLRDRAANLASRSSAVADIVDGTQPTCAEAKGNGLKASHAALFDIWSEMINDIEALLQSTDYQLDRMAGRLS